MRDKRPWTEKRISCYAYLFSAAFDRVSHSGFLYKLPVVRVGGAVFDVIAGFLSG